MKLTKAILRPLRAAVRGGGVSISLFSRRPRLTDGGGGGGGQGTSSSGVSAAAGGKKRGGGRFENPEPSSPKVTCIGQVRVKSKRRAKQSLRSLSGGRPIGEASFRKPEQIITSHADRHRWVHLPICVCEALRGAFAAAEFSCCCSSGRRECCLSSAGGGGNCGCWAVLGRWLVSVFFCGGGRQRKEIIEVVVGGGDTDVIVKEDHNQEEEKEEAINKNEKNEVLLMRCRSDEINEEEEEEDQNADFDGVRGFGEVKENEEEEEDYKEEEDSDESNMSSFEALLDQENTDQLPRDKNDVDDVISDKDTSSPFVGEQEEEAKPEEEAAAMVVLPECLLLMMCEPKLSMEVSKETWVCSTDFVRRPERPQKAANAAANGGGCCHHGAAVKRRQLVVVDQSKPPTAAKPNVPAAPPSKKNDGLQPARSSCSLPAAAPSMAAVIEQKLGAAGYEPFALTRCKSEPMRTAAAKVMPESCLWKNGVVEPEPLGAGAGAAGVGF
ncbi:hypothetical protein ABFS83_08G187300 [Erythranthe nasuta]